jgi:arylsulfatase A-like enzyme
MPRNVILLHTDQQRYDSLGCTGNPLVRTPHLDALAADGTVFTRHFTANPICSPSRASLLTGLYPPGHNVWNNGVALSRREYAIFDTRSEDQRCDARGGFIPQPPTMADMFAGAGYDTASFGKLHLTPYLSPTAWRFPETTTNWQQGLFDDWSGPYYGFQHCELTLGHGEGACHAGHYGHWLQREHPEAVARLREHQPRPFPEIGDLYASTLPFALHHSHWLAERLAAYLRRRGPGDAPFFAFVGFPDPHHPFVPCADIAPDFESCAVQEFVDPEGAGMAGSPVLPLNQQSLAEMGISAEAVRQAIRYTYALVYQIDLAVGMITAALQEAGLADDTIVAFTSDHGDYLGDHGHLRKGFGASGSLLHVPLLIRAPGSDLPSRVDLPVSNADVMPTLAALAGVTPPPVQHGADVSALVRDGRTHQAFAFSTNGDVTSLNHTICDERYRLTWYPGVEDFVELFDHANDPGECRNVAGEAQHREAQERLLALLKERLAGWYSPILARTAAW